MKRIAVCFLVAAGCSTPPAEVIGLPARALESPAIRPESGTEERLTDLTLEDAWARAERLHPELAAARARVEAAQARALQAGLFPNPDLIVRMEVAPIREGTTSRAEYVGGFGHRLPLGDRRSAAVRLEERERDRLEKELDVRRLEVRSRIHAAFATALYLEEAIRIWEEAYRTSDRGAAVARARLAAGDALPEDVARAEMEALRLLSERDQTASRRQEALLALAAAVGDPRLRVESVRGSLEDALAIPALESLLATLSDHPLPRAADAAAAVERAREELARAQAVPDLNVELLYRRQEATHTDAFDAGLSIALPLFDRNQGRIREAGAELTAAQAKARRVLSELEHEVREAHLRLTRAMARVRLLREEILPRSDTVLRGAELRYAGGDMSLADLLPIRRDRLQVRLSYLEALREAIEAWRVLKPYLAPKG